MPPLKCWLCLNSSDEHAQRLHNFMLRNVASVDVESMTDMFHADLHEATNGAEGTGKDEIRQHIQGGHLLCPSLLVRSDSRLNPLIVCLAML